MKRCSERNEEIFNFNKKKKNDKNNSSFDLLYDCKEGYSFCKKNNFNNLNGLLIEKNIFLFNFILSIKYNEEKKKKKNSKNGNDQNGNEQNGNEQNGNEQNGNEQNDDNQLDLYYFFQNQKILINHDNLESTKFKETITEHFEKDEKVSNSYDKKIEIFYEKKFKFLLKSNYFFYIKRYIHNILTNVDICTHDKPNETFFEFFSIFKNDKKKIWFENGNELLSDIYFDVSEVSDDSDYNYFYEKANQIVEFDEEHMELDNEEECVETKIEKSNSLPNNLEYNKNDKFNKFEKRVSIFSPDYEKKKKKNKERRFEKYICRCCLKQKKDMHNFYNNNNEDGENIFYAKFSNVCLLQIFMSNLTTDELKYWVKIKDCIENMLGNIKSNIFYKGMSNYVELPYIEMLDHMDNTFKFIKKKKKLIILKKKSKIIKCLFEKTYNSIRISVKYKIISGNQKFDYFCKDAMQKYQKKMKKNIFTNNSSNFKSPHDSNNGELGEVHNYLNPIVFKNKVKKDYDFSILIHTKHIEIYGYIYMRNYIFFLLIMIEVYMFIHFNEISYTYSSNTEIFLDQILKNLFT
ncbi:conserved Plasmodium protein, unknown function [Plasmodium vinckei vinckei]|uniref:Uncharacterized protein n=1 Tax=Plasmodium vinckei vinckei TaxID=54757 RepID=A0A449BWS4_PLAVN|nr:conserved Plasmodium protein, unknown function [Plasmodium vinckei vinckei]KEG03609.1 hypothetical protein YYE_01633 [Plasmodium vinckei vinckei]VEV57904.1 conserved Plasmodium protein, unknown function [Plasmodium vinckei vinckei]